MIIMSFNYFREGQVTFAQKRVTNVEKFYGLFCDTLGSVIRKSARLRDKGKFHFALSRIHLICSMYLFLKFSL